jgi:hypothetical protein
MLNHANILSGATAPHHHTLRIGWLRSFQILVALIVAISTAAAASGDIYGPGIGGDGLANTCLGGPYRTDVQYNRFRAEQSSALTSFTMYYLGSAVGYAGGTGGTWKAEIFADDGTANHLPTGSALATQRFAALAANVAGRTLTFSSPATLVAGRIYHLVYTNTDAAPATNYFSSNHWYYAHTPTGTADGRLNPRFPATDWEHAFKVGSTWYKRAGYAPVLDLGYANGMHQGQSYGEASYGAGEEGKINGPSNMVRERFTVSGGDKTVTGVGLRLLKIAGGLDPLTVRLEDASSSTRLRFRQPELRVARVQTAPLATRAWAWLPNGSGAAFPAPMF